MRSGFVVSIAGRSACNAGKRPTTQATTALQTHNLPSHISALLPTFPK